MQAWWICRFRFYRPFRAFFCRAGEIPTLASLVRDDKKGAALARDDDSQRNSFGANSFR